MVSVSELDKITNYTPVQTELERALPILREELAREETQGVDDIEDPTYQINDELTLQVEGTPIAATVEDISSDGILLRFEDGRTEEFSAEQVEAMRVEPDESTQPQSEAAPQEAEDPILKIKENAPKQKNGEVDYDALLSADPDAFATLYESEEGIEETAKEIKSVLKNVEKKIVAAKKGIENADSINKKRVSRAALASLEGKKSSLTRILERYATGENPVKPPTESSNLSEINPKNEGMQADEDGNLPESGVKTEMEEQDSDPTPIGKGPFGFIYDQFKGKAKEAIDFLMRKKEGEAVGALHHPEIGDIDLVWGNKKAGIEKIATKHPEVLSDLQGIFDNLNIISKSDNRIKLESDTHFAVVSREFLGESRPQWLLTAYQKKETPKSTNSRMDVESNQNGLLDDTATQQNLSASSANKDIESVENKQEKIQNIKPKGVNSPNLTEKENGKRKESVSSLSQRVSQDNNGEEVKINGRMEEASDVVRREKEAAGGAEPAEGYKRGQIEALKTYAQANGLWIEDRQPLGQYLSRGGENVVYSLNDESVFKLNNFEFAGDDLTNFFDRMKAHNELFPEVRYALIGFSENDKKEFCAVLEQPFVHSAREATAQEISNEMDRMGFSRVYDDEFQNDRYVVFDVAPHNVLMGKDGLLYFIDTQINVSKLEPPKPKKKAKKQVEKPKDPIAGKYAQARFLDGSIVTGEVIKTDNRGVTIRSNNGRIYTVGIDRILQESDNPIEEEIRFRDANPEELRITQEAKANGSYLKAPNGEDSKLTHKQWVQVRTKAFKAWFGDWEKQARIEKLRNSKSINAEFNGEFELDRISAKQWMKDNLRKEYTNRDSGEKIEITKVGINEVTSHGSKDNAHLKSLLSIPKMIEESIFIDEVQNTKDNDKYDSYRYYVCGLTIDGVDYTAKVVVGVKGDSKYYDHRLTEIEKGNLIENLNGLSNSVANNQTPLVSEIKDTKLISILQTNSSKIVDENGEPLVVYHGTDAEFYEFNHDKRTKNGFFFTQDKAVASSFNGGGRIVEAFLDIKSPMQRSYSPVVSKKMMNSGNDGIISEKTTPEHKIPAYIVFSPNQIKSATENTGDFSTESNDIRLKTIEDTNEQFNKTLGQLTEENADSIVFDLGIPSKALLSAGVADKPIKLYGNKVIKKMKKHGFSLDELKNLPNAVADPIVVFKNKEKTGNYSVLTELKSANGNFLVTLDLGKDADIDFNLVSSVFGKAENSVVDWINRGIALYIDKEKALSFLSHHPALIAGTAANSELSSATKIVESFENPTVNTGKIASEIENLSDTLHTPVKIVRDVSEITDPDNKQESRKRAAYGFYNIGTGEVFMVLPNLKSVADAQATLLHEIVGHKGIRGLLGEKANGFFQEVFNSLPEQKQQELIKKYKDPLLAADEYVAQLAETANDNPTIWAKVVSAIREFFRNLGIDLKITDSDIRYMLWKSKNRIMQGDSYITMAEKVVKDTRFREANKDTVENVDQKSDANSIKSFLKDQFSRENWVDAMVSVQELQKQIAEITGGPIKGFEDVYRAINHLPGINRNEHDVFESKYFYPIAANIHTIIAKSDKKITYRDVVFYLIGKSGIERNDKFAVRDADAWLEKNLQKLNESLKKGEVDPSVYGESKSELEKKRDEKLKKFQKNDYSGLTALKKATQKEAHQIVADFESTYPSECKKLWESINKATKWTLRKSYESGQITKEQYENIRDMFEYYIPMRGFDEKTAEDTYEYMSKPSSFEGVIKSATGRNSLSEDPIAYIAQMADSAILGGNKNNMKRHLLRLAQNHKTPLLTVSETWYENVGTEHEPIWEARYPEYSENPDEFSENLRMFEENMLMKSNLGLAKKDFGKLNVGMRINRKSASEHMVTVMQNGRSYTIYFNGSPRAAQAINGMLNSDITGGKVVNTLLWCRRQLAANFTTRNPAFVLSNLSRDMIFAETALAIKEGWPYVKTFNKNLPEACMAIMRGINNASDPKSNRFDALFEEFLKHGGETGYGVLQSLESQKKYIKNELRKLSGETDPTKIFRMIAQSLENMNRWAEDMSRFTTYVTSREMGRNITDSITDAKNVTVNFNTKGRLSGIAAPFRVLYVFFNAGVQGLDNIVKLGRKNPIGLTAASAAFLASGFFMSMLNHWLSMFDDEEDEYSNLPDWVRMNNFTIGYGGKFATIPLPIEMRAFYGLGDLAYQYAIGNREDKNIATDVLKQVTAMLPLDLSEGSNALVPSILSPLYQAYVINEDFTGKPIYRDNSFNKFMPEYTKAYAGTSKAIVKFCEGLNTIGDGNSYKKGYWLFDVNPAKLEHVIEGYTGGMGSTINKTAKTLWSAINGEVPILRNIPVASNFAKTTNDEYSRHRRTNDLYFYYQNVYNEIAQQVSGFSRDAISGNEAKREKARHELNRLRDSGQYETYRLFGIMKGHIDKIRKLEKQLSEFSGSENARNALLDQIAALKTRANAEMRVRISTE